MKIGNVVAQTVDIRMMNKIDIIHYTSDISEIIPSLPTMIIGWKYVQSLYPNDNLSILKQDLGNNIWWCFSQFEKRVKYQECIQSFYENIINNIKRKIKYNFLNIFVDDIEYIKDIISIIKSTITVKCYVHYNSFMYIHFNDEVVGINLQDLEYIGVEKKKVIKLLYNHSNNIVFYDYKFIPNDILKILKNNMYLIPYFK